MNFIVIFIVVLGFIAFCSALVFLIIWAIRKQNKTQNQIIDSCAQLTKLMQLRRKGEITDDEYFKKINELHSKINDV